VPSTHGYRYPVPGPLQRSRSFGRAGALERMGRDTFDVLVIGAGVTGCGVALDAAARGLRTALVDAGDLASGTSSKSSKLVHGGLRYLSQGEYRLVAEALAERQRLLANAPHLVKPLPFLIPLFSRDEDRSQVKVKGLAKAYSTALWLYDLAGGLRIGRRHRRVVADEARRHLPSLRAEGLVDAFLYWDAQADDARLTLALARSAADHGAAVASYAPVTALIEADDRITGARLADGTVIRAAAVVNAGGVWSEQVAGLSPSPTGHVPIRPAKGVHLAVPADRLPCDYATVLSVPGDRRSVFVVPWDAATAPGPSGPGRFTYIGTTDTEYDGPLGDPRVTPEDVDYVLSAVNAWTTTQLTAADVTGTWAGLRPLLAEGTEDETTADLSRIHRVDTSRQGLVTVTGGKLTTYRAMAADTVDAVLHLLGRRLTYCPTRRLALRGADGTAGLDSPEAAARLGVAPGVLAHLAGRYGGEARAVVAMLDADPSLAAPMAEGLPYLRAEALYAARYEMVHTLADVLYRRTRAGILDREATAVAAPAVADLIGGELGWSPERRAAEVAAVLAEVDAERAALGLATTAR
jgi:glycerol-3-phosphate dehydrogenase